MDQAEKGSEVVSAEDGMRSCVNCGTTKTPLWRGGPAGPKSLCNACGIRTRKKRRPAGVPNKVLIVNKKAMKKSSNLTPKAGKFGSSLKQRFLVLRREVLMKGWSDNRKFGEVEQAAVLLMALSYGSVYG
ncbi:hypothetical protein MLD38_016370 [Melastoma candidum]|uniref:Uncharacterized protein n=1 Tax=Melastoma candidum TaxID=119954 RepID=A0ACB9RJ86_9MYRT|nr:hypothetical protein MLD38_016370 [Melastoma candidum]